MQGYTPIETTKSLGTWRVFFLVFSLLSVDLLHFVLFPHNFSLFVVQKLPHIPLT